MNTPIFTMKQSVATLFTALFEAAMQCETESDTGLSPEQRAYRFSPLVDDLLDAETVGATQATLSILLRQSIAVIDLAVGGTKWRYDNAVTYNTIAHLRHLLEDPSNAKYFGPDAVEEPRPVARFVSPGNLNSLYSIQGLTIGHASTADTSKSNSFSVTVSLTNNPSQLPGNGPDLDMNGYETGFTPLPLNEKTIKEFEDTIIDSLKDIDRCVEIINDINRLNETLGAEATYEYYDSVIIELSKEKEDHRQAVRGAIHNANRAIFETMSEEERVAKCEELFGKTISTGIENERQRL